MMFAAASNIAARSESCSSGPAAPGGEKICAAVSPRSGSTEPRSGKKPFHGDVRRARRVYSALVHSMPMLEMVSELRGEIVRADLAGFPPAEAFRHSPVRRCSWPDSGACRMYALHGTVRARNSCRDESLASGENAWGTPGDLIR